MLSAEQLGEMSKAELNELAKSFDIAAPVKIKKDDLVDEIVAMQVRRSGLENANGVLDILPEGYGFLRRDGYLIGNDDIYISQSQIRRFELRRGDLVAGQVRRPKENEKYYGIVKVETVNGFDPEAIKSRRSFDDLLPLSPSRRWSIVPTLDLFAPLGRGARALVTVPARTDATSTLVMITRAIAEHDPDAHIIVLSIDGRPEDAQCLQRRIDGEIVATTFDEHPDHHIATAELVMERAKRLVEVGADVTIVLDSLTRLGRAYAHGGQGPNRTGLDLASIFKPKRYFGAARACEEGGSLTIVATLALDSPVPYDNALADEIFGIANCEIALDRDVASARIEPPLDLRMSFTRDDEQLLADVDIKRSREARGLLAGRSALDAMLAASDLLAHS